MRVNETDVSAFFSFLAPANEVFTYYNLNESGSDAISGEGCQFGIGEEIAAKFVEAGKLHDKSKGPWKTLHVVLNKTTLSGRKRKDIIAPRVLCVDLDRWVPREEIRGILEEYAPDLVVRTSILSTEEGGEAKGKYHLYWKISSTISLEKWEEFQTGFAFKFSSDFNLASRTHGLRVPGVERVQKDGSKYVPEIVYAKYCPDEVIPERGEVQIFQEFPWLLEAMTEGRLEKKGQKGKIQKVSAKVLEVLRGEASEVNGTMKELVGEGAPGRNVALYQTVKDWCLELPLDEEVLEEDAVRVGLEFNKALELGHPGGGLEWAEVEKTVRSAMVGALEVRAARKEKAAKNLEKLEEVEESRSEPIFQYDYTTKWLSNNRFSFQAAVERLVQRFSHVLVRTGKLVYAFDDRDKLWRSQKGSQEIIGDYVKRVLLDVIADEKLIPELCTNSKGEFSAKEYSKVTMNIGSAYYYNSTVSLTLQSNDIRRMDIGNFDNNSNLIFCGNGVLDVRTGKVRPAEALDYLLQQTKVEWKGFNEDCPGWKRFLGEVFSENEAPEEMVSFMQELFGYSLTGSVDSQYVFIHWGGACNGKSLLLSALKSVAGDYCTTLSAPVLARSKNSIAKEFERVGAKIEGKRVCVIDDLETATQWNEGLIKTLTGSTIPARKLYEEERDIPNRAKFHIGCNEVPTPQSENRGILRRLCIIPYLRTFEQDAGKERELRAMMQRELSGILAWSVEGLKRLTARGGKLELPTDTRNYIEEYTEENFTLQSVLDEYLFRIGREVPVTAPEVEMSMREIFDGIVAALEEKGAGDKAAGLTEKEVQRVVRGSYRAEAIRVRESGGVKKRLWRVTLKRAFPVARGGL